LKFGTQLFDGFRVQIAIDKVLVCNIGSMLPPLRAPPEKQYANDFTIQRDFNFGA